MGPPGSIRRARAGDAKAGEALRDWATVRYLRPAAAPHLPAVPEGW